MPRIRCDAVSRIGVLCSRSVHYEQPRVDFWYLVRGGHNNVIAASWLVVLPRRLEELEKLFNHRGLVRFGYDSNQEISEGSEGRRALKFLGSTECGRTDSS